MAIVIFVVVAAFITLNITKTVFQKVTGDSVSLGIRQFNKNRPNTVKVLKKIAPGIDIYTHELR